MTTVNCLARFSALSFGLKNLLSDFDLIPSYSCFCCVYPEDRKYKLQRKPDFSKGKENWFEKSGVRNIGGKITVPDESKGNLQFGSSYRRRKSRVRKIGTPL